jgi:hypothetical protein
MFVAFVHPYQDSRSVLRFVNNLSQTGWVTTMMCMDFTNYGDTVVGPTTIIVDIHHATESSVKNSSSKLQPANCHYVLNPSFGKTSTKWNMVSLMRVRMMTLGRNHTRASPHPFYLIQYPSPFRMVSNLCISFTQVDQIPQYWQAL